MDLNWRTALISGVFVYLGIQIFRRRAKAAKRSLPPSVPGFPFIGNTFQLLSLTHLQLDEWKKQLGPIYSLNAFGNTIVVIANAEIASDILDKMSEVTSSRPTLIMAGKLMTRNNVFATHKYGDKWRKHRRAAHDALRALEDFFPVQEDEALLLVRDLASVSGEAKGDLEANLRRLASSTIWRIMYGGPPLRMLDDGDLREVNDIADRLIKALTPGEEIVDILPALNSLPSSLAPFKRYASKFFARTNAFFIRLANEAIERKFVFNDPMKLSFCAQLNDQRKARNLSDEDIAWICGTMYAAGTEPGAAVLHYFFLAMILNPHVACKARENLDTEVGERPPTFADRDRLPYIDAIVKEVLRWRPVAPMGIPHEASEDFTYKDYTIPKGAMIVNNLWSITHDPALFTDPEEFRPERFLESEESQPLRPYERHNLPFGYGRRICVGQYVAVNTLFITIAMLLWAFEFKKAVDDRGNEITPPAAEFVKVGISVRPEPFPFKLVLRSQAAKALERTQATV